MAALSTLHFSIRIDAPVERVWRLLQAPDTYSEWTAPFCEAGSSYEGSWEEGQKIRFLTPSGDGMVAIIAENRLHEFLSIRPIGMINAGIEDLHSEQARTWGDVRENYSFRTVDGGTELTIDQGVPEEFEAMMRDTWPKALAKLKALCERPA